MSGVGSTGSFLHRTLEVFLFLYIASNTLTDMVYHTLTHTHTHTPVLVMLKCNLLRTSMGMPFPYLGVTALYRDVIKRSLKKHQLPSLILLSLKRWRRCVSKRVLAINSMFKVPYISRLGRGADRGAVVLISLFPPSLKCNPLK